MNHTMTIYVYFERLQFIYMEQLVLKHPLRKIFKDFLEKSGCDPKQFRGISKDNLPIIEDVVGKVSLFTISILKMETSWEN